MTTPTAVAIYTCMSVDTDARAPGSIGRSRDGTSLLDQWVRRWEFGELSGGRQTEVRRTREAGATPPGEESSGVPVSSGVGTGAHPVAPASGLVLRGALGA